MLPGSVWTFRGEGLMVYSPTIPNLMGCGDCAGQRPLPCRCWAYQARPIFTKVRSSVYRNIPHCLMKCAKTPLISVLMATRQGVMDAEYPCPGIILNHTRDSASVLMLRHGYLNQQGMLTWPLKLRLGLRI